MHKFCKKCENTRTTEEFSMCSSNKDGLQNMCKLCWQQYRTINRDKLLAGKKIYDIEHKEQKHANMKIWYEENREYVLQYKRDNYNLSAKLAYNKKYRIQRIKEDPSYKLKGALRRRLNIAIKKGYKSGSAVKDLGCSVKELKIYLESKFKLGMTWDNWSRDGWHIDHIIPLSSFDLTDYEQLKKACHYTNLQPLWAKENMSKGDKIKENFLG